MGSKAKRRRPTPQESAAGLAQPVTVTLDPVALAELMHCERIMRTLTHENHKPLSRSAVVREAIHYLFGRLYRQSGRELPEEESCPPESPA